jgi:regulator of protease activity HflC (stomatin/prohibitin superfamily)
MKKALILIVALLVLGTTACKQIDSTELGVRVINLPPIQGVQKTTLFTGAKFHLPWIMDIYTLPRAHQTIEMIEAGKITFKTTGAPVEVTKLTAKDEDAPELPADQLDQVKRELAQTDRIQIVDHDRRSGNQSVRIKTADGNDAWVDVVVVYEVAPDKAHLVVEKVGTSADDLKRFVAAMVRGTLRSWLSELDSKEILRPTDREAKINGNLPQLNQELSTFGVQIIKLLAPEVAIHPGYEDVLSKKRVAEEEKDEYEAYQAKADQEKETKVNKARGEADAMIALANGRLQRAFQEGDAELEAKRLEAEALEIKYNETGRGIAAQTALLGGPGGDAQVSLAIAQSITGKPIVIVPSTGAFNTLDVNEIIQTYGGIKAISNQVPAATTEINPVICPLAQPPEPAPAPKAEPGK